MGNMAAIDKNFIINTNIDKSDIKFYDVKDKPFKVYGVYYDGSRFVRMPAEVAKSVSTGVYSLHWHTAGGRVRFKTDSPYIAIHAKIPGPAKMSHFALSGSTGFDLYGKYDGEDRYLQSFAPPFDIKNGYEMVKELGNGEMREYTINFPLYSTLTELYIGLSESSSVLPPNDYALEYPVVYYGSSITQGGCASRPGNTYQSILSRKFNIDHINLGFSGNAKGENEMTDYIKGLKMSAFVLDYDHNAPTPEHLAETHEKMFMAVRGKHPDIPIVIMNRPQYYLYADGRRRREIVETTYNNAVNRGDKNVYFVSNDELCSLCGNEGTVDGCHPTDLGFYSMAKALEKVFEKIF